MGKVCVAAMCHAYHCQQRSRPLPVVAATVLAAGLALMAGGCAHTSGDFALFPGEVRGWMPDGPGGVYDAETLYGYIDGGAEVYLAFNVQKVFARQYVKKGAPDIIVDVFDMGSPADAYGAYHHDIREGRDAGIGLESEYMEGALSFWQGRHFVSIIAFDETEDSEQAVLALGKAVAGALCDEGAPPDILEWLPQEGLLQSEVHYFHTHLTLSSHYFLADENLLNLDKNTEGILARYKAAGSGVGVSPHVFLLIRYPSVSAAETAHASFLKGYLPDADGEGIAQTENGKWAGVRTRGNFLIGAFDVPSKGELQRGIGEIKQHLEGSEP